MTYCMEQETLENENLGSYITNNIIAVENEKVMHRIHDVCINPTEVEALVENLNTYHVSLCHLNEIIEDWIASR